MAGRTRRRIKARAGGQGARVQSLPDPDYADSSSQPRTFLITNNSHPDSDTMGHRLPGSAGFQPAASSRKRRYEYRPRARMPAIPGRARPWQAHRTGMRIVRNQENVCSVHALHQPAQTRRLPLHQPHVAPSVHHHFAQRLGHNLSAEDEEPSQPAECQLYRWQSPELAAHRGVHERLHRSIVEGQDVHEAGVVHRVARVGSAYHLANGSFLVSETRKREARQLGLRHLEEQR